MEIDNQLKERFRDGALGSVYGLLFGKPWITIPLLGLVLMIILGWYSADFKFLLISGGVFALMLLAGAMYEVHRRREHHRRKALRAELAAAIQQHYLARWSAEPRLWRAAGAAMLRKRWFFLVFLLAQISVQTWIALMAEDGIFGRNTEIYVTLLTLSIALTTLVAQGIFDDIARAFSRTGTVEIYLGNKGILVDGQLYSWAAEPYSLHAGIERTPLPLLTLRLAGSSVKGIIYLLIRTFTVFGGAVALRDWLVRVPFPEGMTDEIENAVRTILRDSAYEVALREAATNLKSSSTLSGAGYSRMLVEFVCEISEAKNGVVGGIIANKHDFTVNDAPVTYNGRITVVNRTTSVEIHGDCLLGMFSVQNVPMNTGDVIAVRFRQNDGSEVETEPIIAYTDDSSTFGNRGKDETEELAHRVAEARMNAPGAEINSPRLPKVLLAIIWAFGSYTAAADYLFYRGTSSMRTVALLRNDVLRTEEWLLTAIEEGSGTPFDALWSAAGMALFAFILGGLILAGFERLFRLKNNRLTKLWFIASAGFALQGVVRALFFPTLTVALNTETRQVEVTEWHGFMPEIAALPEQWQIPFDSIVGFTSSVYRAHRENAEITILSVDFLTKAGSYGRAGATEVAAAKTHGDSVAISSHARRIVSILDSVVGAKRTPVKSVSSGRGDEALQTIDNPDSSTEIPPPDSVAVVYAVICDTSVEISYIAPAGPIMTTQKTRVAKGVWKRSFNVAEGAYLSVMATTSGFATSPVTVEITLNGKRFRRESSSIGLVSAEGTVAGRKIKK